MISYFDVLRYGIPTALIVLVTGILIGALSGEKE